MSNGKKRTNIQSLHGKLCVSLYEQLGEMVLPIIKQTYGSYGRELGSGFKKKWNPESFEVAMTSFAKMCNDGGMPLTIQMEGNSVHVQGSVCPFELGNTHYKVCEAMMEMDLEMLRVLTGEERLEMYIEKTIAAGDSVCKMIYSIK
ncbi:MAG: hypothetical protein CVU87_13345 [Firmicutes bacterium HGW-Firmicutes-12]|jgi:hypothetical protein|nr:MAG: hypothetical protein CVU87_13345 [Firmicutes bacterium HGW-Firmicutes-12]